MATSFSKEDKQITPPSSTRSQKISIIYPPTIAECESNGFLNASNNSGSSNSSSGNKTNTNNVTYSRPPSASMIVSTISGIKFVRFLNFYFIFITQNKAFKIINL